MRTILFLALSSVAFLVLSQPLEYVDYRGNSNLAGPIQIADLKTGSYQSWFEKAYNETQSTMKKQRWAKALKGKEVEIYMGTWCGDSRYWVPRFIRLWDELGLDRSQLKITALYNDDDRYKQGPNAEEAGKDIHRVPTFIFKEDGAEYARIVESPATSVETDLAQIALGFPPQPNYRAATYIMELLKEKGASNVEENWDQHLPHVRHMVGRPSELNTLGYVYLRSGRTEEALIAFQFNAQVYAFDPNVHDSLGEAYEVMGSNEKARECYQKALSLNPESSAYKARLEAIGS